jgi:hypothetical protein
MCLIAAAGKAYTVASGKKYFVSNPTPMVKSYLIDVLITPQFPLFNIEMGTSVLLLLQPWPAHS